MIESINSFCTSVVLFGQGSLWQAGKDVYMQLIVCACVYICVCVLDVGVCVCIYVCASACVRGNHQRGGMGA